MRQLLFTFVLFYFIQSGSLFAQQVSVLKSSIWATPTCDVCWENPEASNQVERTWVRQAVSRTWELESRFRFRGWGACNAASRGIRIRIADTGPHVKALGRYLDGIPNGMELNFSFNNWVQGCRGDRQSCIEGIAVHEFGHALGIAHEHNDCVFQGCTDAPQGTTGDYRITPCDLHSVMNYCNPRWNGDGKLSALDIQGVTYLYGSPIAQIAVYGDVIKMKHKLTGQHLHSHEIPYGHSRSSKQQQVTAFGGSDDNDYWLIKVAHGASEKQNPKSPVQHNDIIRLEHYLTRHNLHSHSGFSSPITSQQEITCFGTNGIGDASDNWRVEVEDGGIWTSDKLIRLIHVNTNHALHSHAGYSHPQWTTGQQEVTGFGGRDAGDFWHLTESITQRQRNYVTYGNTIKLKHSLSGNSLHSHDIPYGHPKSSRQQQVTAYSGADDNDYWFVKGSHGTNITSLTNLPLRHNDIIRLEHLITKRNLHSHAGFPSPITPQQEVTCFGTNGIGDANDNWRVEVENGSIWSVGKRVRLVHVNTNQALHSHAGYSHPQWTTGQQEVTGWGGRDAGDFWIFSQFR